jgi:XTP/dITP diphosphohydrolase
MELLLATRNAHKTREFAQILRHEFEVSDLSGAPSSPIEETGYTFEENAILKAVAVSREIRTAQRAVPTYVVADDSGLEVDALNGAPGIFSARYAGENATDRENIDKLLRELANEKRRAARFRCVIVLARDGVLLGTFEGVADGMIVDPARGDHGFGYDPIFMPRGFDKTFGELAVEIKNKISHRAKAIAKLREALQPPG